MGKFTVVGNNNSDKNGILNLLRKYIFGKEQIDFFDENTLYNAGDNVYILDNYTGELKIITALEDGIIGKFDESEWTENITNVSGEVIVISEKEPTNQSVQMWLYPRSYSSHILEMPDPEVDPDEPVETDPIPDYYTSVNLIVDSDNNIPIVDTVNAAELNNLEFGDIVIDTENIEVLKDVEGLTSIIASGDVFIDEQDDIFVNNRPPQENDPSFLWIDTDLSDD